MLTVHHLGKSQSERIVWLCEELGLDYALERYDRDPATMAAPPAYKALHPLGAAPVIDEDGVVLAESEAIVAYIMGRHGAGDLAVDPADPDYPHYVYWRSFPNGTLLPGLSRTMIMTRAGLAADSPLVAAMAQRTTRTIELTEARLAAAPFLAGERVTAADIMMVFVLSTMRYFAPFDLAPYPAIRAYLARIGERPAYRRAMAKGDPDMALLLD